MFELLTAVCDGLMECGAPGYDIMVTRDGREIFRRWNGWSDVENRVPVNGKERYNIFSCSKVITCAAALQWMERGAFSLEDPLSCYLPEFAEMTVESDAGVTPAENPILIRHLFEMTSGMDYNLRTPELRQCREETGGRFPTRETMKYLAREPLGFEPGTSWKYSLSHDVLAALVEVLAGEPFEEYVRKNIFLPAGMKNSTFMPTAAEAESVVPQYEFRNGKTLPRGKNNVYRLGPEYASGGAGCVSTVEDYIRFLEALRTGKLVKPETVRLMATDRLTPAQRKAFVKKEDYGYGLGVRCSKGDPHFPDFGWAGAAGAYLGIDPEWNVSFYFASNVFNMNMRECRLLFAWIIRTELSGNTADRPLIAAELARRSEGRITI